MKRHLQILSIIVIYFFIFTKITKADGEIVGRWPYGPCKAVAVDANYAYIGTGGMIKVIDISDPLNPAEVSSITTNGAVENLFKSGDYLYVANRDKGLGIFYTKNPSDLIKVGSFPVLGDAEDVYVEGKYAYIVGTSDCGMYILDISDPSLPTEIGHSDQCGYSVYVSGNYAYLGTGDFIIMDISDPTNPVAISWLQGRLSEWIDVGETYVYGDYAYLGLWNQGLYVVNISDPSNPVVESRLYPTDWIWSVCGHDSFVYVIGCGIGLAILDVSDPTNITETGHCLSDSIGDVSGLCVAGNYAYIADVCNLKIVDIEDTSHPKRSTQLTFSGYVMDVFASGNYAYVVNYDFNIIDVSDPSNPYTIGYIDSLDSRLEHGDATGVYISGDYAYVVGYEGRLSVIDISDPSNPVLLGGYNTFDDAQEGGVFQSGDYAYVAGEGGGLCIIDVSDPSHPTQVSTVITSAGTWDVHVSGMYAYVTDFNDGNLYIIDVSTPSDPQVVSTLHLQEHAEKVFVSGNYAYATSWEDDGDNRLHIIDISDKSEPIETSYYNFLVIRDIQVVNKQVYVANEVYGISILDVSDPYHPIKVDSVESPTAFDMFVGEQYTYVIDKNYGMYILNYGTANVENPNLESPLKQVALHQNYPNPFNPLTRITYQLPTKSQVTLKIIDIQGREINTLAKGMQPAGTNSVVWDGRNSGGKEVGSGVYFCRLEINNFSQVRKLLLIR